MKTLVYALEIVVDSNNHPTFLLRNPQNGQVVSITNSASDVAKFLNDSLEPSKEVVQ